MAEQAPGPSAQEGPGARLNPAALTPADAAHLLSRAGGQRITEAMLRADIDAGAPTNADGTINLVQYAAWLVKQSGVRGLESGARYGSVDADGFSAPDSRLWTPDCAD